MGSVGLAGRTKEVRSIAAFLAGDTDAEGMFVAGDAGVGKSRLVTAAAAALTSPGDLEVLFGWCLQLSRGLPFLPMLDVFRQLAEVDDGQLVKAVFADCPSFVSGELRWLLPELEEPAQAASLDADGGWRRERMLAAMRRFFATLGQLRPVALVIEDVHWADESTLECLDYLLAPGHAVGVPMLITCRSAEAPSQPLSDWWERAHRNPGIVRVDLPPLTEAETAEQIAMLLGQEPPSALVANIYARSEGNAFFTEQLLAERDASGDDALPAGLRSLLLSRTAHVSEVASEVLRVLAVAARPMEEASVALICDHPAPLVRDALRELLARGLLRRPDRAGRHGLRHALLAEAVSTELLPSERSELHGRIADVMAEDGNAAVAAQIAEHYEAASRAQDELRWRTIAGRHAQTVYAAREASQHWRRAVALWDLVSEPAALAGNELGELYQRAWITTEEAGDGVAAEALAEAALTRLASTASPLSLLNLYWAVGHFRSIHSDEGLAALAKAIEIGEQLAPSREYILALADYATELHVRGRYRESESFASRALYAARDLGDHAQQRKQAMALAGLAAAQGNIEAARARLHDAIQIHVDPDDDPVTALTTAILHTDLLLTIGELAQVADTGQGALDSARRSGLSASHGASVVCSNMYEALIEIGDLTRAAALLDAVAIGSPTRDTRMAHVHRADLDMRQGRLEQAAAFWTVNHDMLASIGALEHRYEFALRHAELNLWRHEPEAAFSRAHTTLQAIYHTDSARFLGPLFVLALRACADRAQRARARSDADDLEDALRAGACLADLLADAQVNPFADHPIPVTCVADSLAWQAEHARLHHEPSTGPWERTAAAWDRLARPHRAAYARWRQAEGLLAVPHAKPTAQPVLRVAARQAVGYVPLADAIDDLARRARIDLSQPHAGEQRDKPPVTRRFALTDRELAVLRLLARGKSNPQIGAELFISAKTASVHVSSILRKLHVATRVEAAAVAERAGLLLTEAPPNR